MRESPPTTCPRCRYELDRVAVRGECPECGFPLDEHTVVWRPSGRARSVLVVASFAAPFSIGVWTLARPFWGPPVSDLELVVTGILFVLSAFALAAIMQQNRCGRFLAIGPFGIHARSGRSEVFVRWTDYDYAYGVGRGVRLIRKNGRSPLRVPGVFDSPSEFAGFREAAAAAVARTNRASGSTNG